jgi:hypothetical protein
MTRQEAVALKEQMGQEAEGLHIELGKVTYRKRGWHVHFEHATGGGFAVPSPDAWEDWKRYWRSRGKN